MNSKEYILEILTDLCQAKIDFVLCGGVAAVLHGVERLTMDIDIAINFDRSNVQKFLGVMKDLSMQSRAPIPPDSLLDHEIRQLLINEKNAIVFTFIDVNNPFKQIDIFLEDLYGRLIDSSDEFDITANETLKVVDVKALIKMKEEVKPIRDKDQRDIIELKRLINE
ncbi:hypothetical protein LNTAR_03254 [Lentisphaera araneosa HTCC2155]|jgi:hypothetical protein|uniref:Uncharacterized protein n=1 Tax=Lentisphaera araneosa HTCC2155 TaxID=313628 RepID=A6DT38_9BACT|nr:hypothetical protein [Lentisphaera araneosa]EDM25213.1 hypothetical protein LNTAR_03254 [Lentisphaera araneosa HTCC2155]